MTKGVGVDPVPLPLSDRSETGPPSGAVAMARTELVSPPAVDIGPGQDMADLVGPDLARIERAAIAGDQDRNRPPGRDVAAIGAAQRVGQRGVPSVTLAGILDRDREVTLSPAAAPVLAATVLSTSESLGPHSGATVTVFAVAGPWACCRFRGLVAVRRRCLVRSAPASISAWVTV